VPTASEWFCALLDTATEVYFRYSLGSANRGFAYISPSVEVLTGHAPADFYHDAGLVKRLIAPADRRVLHRLLRAPRAVTLRLHLVRDGLTVPIDLRVVVLVRHKRVVAVEGVARLGQATSGGPGVSSGHPADKPVQQRLTALMFEVHDLLHRMLPAAGAGMTGAASRTLRVGDIDLDLNRLSVTESGRPVALTAREVLLLRYLLERPQRIITRQQLLTDVWSYSYTGDDRTVDVHISRLRRKLPSLRERLVAIRHIGYRLDDDEERRARVANS
jgi:DNA-binding winged helix-turn-helix (wHTH) protein